MAIAPNIFLCLLQFWSIYLNICMNCILFTSKTPQILTIQFCLLRNSRIFCLKNKSHRMIQLVSVNTLATVPSRRHRRKQTAVPSRRHFHFTAMGPSRRQRRNEITVLSRRYFNVLAKVLSRAGILNQRYLVSPMSS